MDGVWSRRGSAAIGGKPQIASVLIHAIGAALQERMRERRAGSPAWGRCVDIHRSCSSRAERSSPVAPRCGMGGHYGRRGGQRVRPHRPLRPRAALERGADLEVVAVNDVADPATLAHLLAHDSTYGRFAADVRVEGDAILVDGHAIRVLAEPDPAALPWRELDVDVVLESTGPLPDARRRRAPPRGRRRQGHPLGAREGRRAGRRQRRPRRQLRRGLRPCAPTTSSPTRRARPTAWRRSPRSCTRPSASATAR